MEVNVAICCQVQLYAEGIRKLLEEDAQINVLGISVENGDVENLINKNPDIIITDTKNCTKILNLHTTAERKNVLLISDKEEDFEGRDLKLMIIEGLGGLLTIDTDAEMLIKAVKKLNEGELWIDHQTLKKVLNKKIEEQSDVHITRKETEVLECICKGLTNKEIARKLHVSEQTVKSHCNHLFKKFGVSNRLKLAMHAPKHFSYLADL
jgi:DNA-binding NarL/FixJ family response regulator